MNYSVWISLVATWDDPVVMVWSMSDGRMKIHAMLTMDEVIASG